MWRILIFLLANLCFAQGYLDLGFGYTDKRDSFFDPEQLPDSLDVPEGRVEPPELYGEEFPTEEASVVFIVDCSGSMGGQLQAYITFEGILSQGNRLDRAKAELASAITMLTPNFKFDLVKYECGQLACFEELTPALPENTQKALDWIFSMENSGGTATGTATAWALQHTGYEKCGTFILLTDGAPNCLSPGVGGTIEKHLEIIRLANVRKATIHVIAIAPSTGVMISFCQQVALQNGPGFYKVVK